MQYETVIRGKASEWRVVIPTKRQAEAMRADGIEVVEVHNSMPVWVHEGKALSYLSLEQG